jgi:pheromone shutdown-related protein TraB
LSEQFTTASESDTLTRIRFGEREIILIGTAHVSAESVNEVRRVIETEKPERVCIEIDEGRFKTLTSHNSWENMDIRRVLKEKKGFLLLANLVLSSFQKRIGLGMGTKPGEEMQQAAEVADENNIPYSFSDRPVQITLNRAWRLSNFWNKMKLLSVLISSALSPEEVSEEQIEELKKSSALQQMMEELASWLPKVKQVLIDERDQYLAASIFAERDKKIVAVIGAGHAPGIINCLKAMAEEGHVIDTAKISEVPKPGIGSKIAPWVVVALLLGVFGLGFYLGGFDKGLRMMAVWALACGTLSALGTFIALGHPLTALVAFLAAPFSAINPFLGIGFFTAPVEFFIRKPKNSDLENLQEDINSLKGWYRNRVTRILLVLFLSSIGNMIGNLAVLPQLLLLLGSRASG